MVEVSGTTGKMFAVVSLSFYHLTCWQNRAFKQEQDVLKFMPLFLQTSVIILVSQVLSIYPAALTNTVWKFSIFICQNYQSFSIFHIQGF